MVKQFIKGGNQEGNWISTQKRKGQPAKIQFGEYSWECYNEALKKDPSIKELNRDDLTKVVQLDKRNIIKVNKHIKGQKIPVNLIHKQNIPRIKPLSGFERIEIKDDGNRQSATLLGDGYSRDAGHTYPSLVKGLNTESFGVYNCDQVYRIKDQITLRPIYTEENGEKIKSKHVTCVIDLDYNGSFSFPPNSFTLSKNGKNVLILFTEDKQVYMYDKESYQKLDKSTSQPTLVMKNMTKELNSTEKLKTYLNL